MMRNIVAFSMLALGLLGSPVQAQSNPIPQRMKILIEDLSPGAARCGIRKEALEAAVSAAMRYNRIAKSDQLLTPTVYVVVTTLADGSRCFTSWGLDISSPHFKKMDDGRYISGDFEFCNMGGILTGADQANRVPETIKRGFDECINQIRTTTL